MMAVVTSFPTSVDQRIRFAIAQKLLLEITYKGGGRIVEPHDYGIQNGVQRLLVYQRRGPARPGQSPAGWRMFDVPKIDSLVVLDMPFSGSRGASHRHHTAWDALYARVN
jgi:hypothetical protein